MNRTGIEYLTHTWSPIAMRCTPVSAGCTNCWHRRMADRLKENKNFPFDVRRAYAGEGPPVLVEERLVKPLRRKKPARIGVQFMGDLWHEDVPFSFVDRVFATVSKAKSHTFCVLTKRPERMFDYFYGENVLDYHGPCMNLWLGVSVENQAAADERREYLRQTPAAVKFVSYEPALAPVDWAGWEFVDQIISGGESGSGARPSHPDCHRATRDFCQKHSIAYFMKQWGVWIPQILFPDIMPSPDGWGTLDDEGNWFPLTTPWNGRQGEDSPEREYVMIRVGKKRAGHLLDGKEWREFPG